MPADNKRPPLRIRWRSKLAEWLHRLADRVARPSVEIEAASTAVGGPPAHWLAMLRERAPHLLEPGAMSGHWASAQQTAQDFQSCAEGSHSSREGDAARRTAPIQFIPECGRREAAGHLRRYGSWSKGSFVS